MLIFLMPPSLDELRRRLRDPRDRVDRRRSIAVWRPPQPRRRRAPEFDHVVVNDDLERVVGEVAGILSGSSSLLSPTTLSKDCLHGRDART